MPSLKDDAAALFDLALNDAQAAAFAAYARDLIVWNAHTNLTAISDPDGIHTRHFLDSLSVIKAIKPRA